MEIADLNNKQLAQAIIKNPTLNAHWARYQNGLLTYDEMLEAMVIGLHETYSQLLTNYIHDLERSGIPCYDILKRPE